MTVIRIFDEASFVVFANNPHLLHSRIADFVNHYGASFSPDEGRQVLSYQENCHTKSVALHRKRDS